MTDKQSLIFTGSFVTTTFSLLGWLCISYLNPSRYIWIISIPIALFIAISNAYIVTEALEKEESR